LAGGLLAGGYSEFAEAFEFGADVQIGDAGDGGFGIEEGSEAATEGGPGAEGVSVSREGDARPILTQGAGVLFAVGGSVEDGDEVEKEILWRTSERGEVAALRCELQACARR